MNTTSQTPYFDTNAAATGTATQAGITSTGDARTGPAPTTAGPHGSDMANKADPRVDSDLNNRAQYAPGTTTSGNVHPQATAGTATTSTSGTSTRGPHSSSLLNKLDPRVNSRTGEMSTKSTNQSGSGAMREPTDTTGTGTGTAGGVGYQPTVPSSSQGTRAAGGANPSTTATAGAADTTTTVPATGTTGTTTAGGQSARTGENVGRGVKSVAAGIHGAGESLRGGLTAAVDSAFGHDQGAAKNAAIADKGEREIETGQFGRSH
ncbi:hypothetical protein BO82DRAFT_356919 [Aspergillus uvarum CBS 121591]|uniref:Uncharacterized protein n=1 Tax=Aspergillus uvarum CBS 121591 TaxID=1448315 RepID=A0A319C4R3_9EURO|nr:hypothetical protein BO82DRAFT_356919 [Aspergillus uvarum CBS 121591]PYH78930.1 hypothetical protein BO82DRAFT_356919 [Aspergillus uvarum CBS 121591]